MARLTKEQRRELANIRDGDESDIVAATRDLAACILRLDGPEEPKVNELTRDLTLAYDERDEARAKLAEVERERDEARRGEMG